MVKALAIETTSRRGAAALAEDGRVVIESNFTAGLNHTSGLLPLVADLVRRGGWTPGEIEELYVSVGPGGFTGTRVGVTFAKTFAFATGARVVAVPTPRVLVENLPSEAMTAAVVVDARRGKIWAERFARGGDDGRSWASIGRGALTTAAELAASLPRPAWLVGEGVAYHRDGFGGGTQPLAVCDDNLPRVGVVAAVGLEPRPNRRFRRPVRARAGLRPPAGGGGKAAGGFVARKRLKRKISIRRHLDSELRRRRRRRALTAPAAPAYTVAATAAARTSFCRGLPRPRM